MGSKGIFSTLLIMWTWKVMQQFGFRAIWMFLLLADSAALISGKTMDDFGHSENGFSIEWVNQIEIINIQIIASNEERKRKRITSIQFNLIFVL